MKRVRIRNELVRNDTGYTHRSSNQLAYDMSHQHSLILSKGRELEYEFVIIITQNAKLIFLRVTVISLPATMRLSQTIRDVK